ncbi:MAG: class I mannose-6-phosphate isomerase [Lentisphaeraceae bacterium]|nr:class I mannose-6-phosphate isomerase [Lentisphaeraceae bacterium]
MNNNFEKYYPLVFKPLYKTSVWGGNQIKSLKGEVETILDDHIGESWELVDRSDCQSEVANGSLSGVTLGELVKEDPEGIVGKCHDANKPFPLLLKIIDAQKDLSLQIHPDNATCSLLKGAEAKTEMWYILDHEIDAEIYKGIKKDVSGEEFLSLAGSPRIKQLINTIKTETGDAYTIYGNTVHAIGKGNLIYEVQQNSDTTYRVTDWGRKGIDGNPRQLHIAQAATCLKNRNYNPVQSSSAFSSLVQSFENESCFLQQRGLSLSPYFVVDEFKLEGKISVANTDHHFETIYAVDGDLKVHSENGEILLRKGQTCLLPANLERFLIEADQKSTFIRVKVA